MEIDKRKKKWISILLAAVLATLCTGCQKQSVQEREPEETVKIKISWWGGAARHQYTEEILDLYTQIHPEVEFEVIESEWNTYFDKLAVQTALGEMPDIVQMDYQYIYTYTKNGSLADLNPYIEDGTIDVSQINTNTLNTGRVDKKMAGMILSTSIISLGYNPEVLGQMEEELPDVWTWEEFAQYCREVHKRTGKYGVVTAAGITKDMNIFQYWVRQYGKELFNEEGTALGFEDSTLIAEFFQYWKDLMDADVTPDEMIRILSLKEDEGPVVTGDAAYIFEWNNYAVKMAEANDGLRITAPPDGGGENDSLWIKPGMFFSVAENSKVKRECAEFINWFVNSKEANALMKGERGTPVSREIRDYLLQTNELSEQQKQMFEYMKKAEKNCGSTPGPEPGGIAEVTEAFNNAGNNVFYGKVSAAEAAEVFFREANRILKKNNE